jgi:hypothetical protein
MEYEVLCVGWRGEGKGWVSGWCLDRCMYMFPEGKIESLGFWCNTLTKVLTILFSSQMALELSPIYPVVCSNVCVCVCVWCGVCGVNDCVRKGMHP